MANRIGQQAALDCFKVVWNTGMDELFHDVMGCHDCVQNGEVSGMLQKFRSFCPIQFPLNFLTYELLSYFVCFYCANIHIHLPSFSFLMTSQISHKAQDETSCILTPL